MAPNLIIHLFNSYTLVEKVDYNISYLLSNRLHHVRIRYTLNFLII